MLLSQQRTAYEFSLAGAARLSGRAAVMVDFRQRSPATVDVYTLPHNEECVGYELNGGLRGRLWIDSHTFDVLRLDHRLAGLVDVRVPEILARRPGAVPSWTLERWDTSIRFGEGGVPRSRRIAGVASIVDYASGHSRIRRATHPNRNQLRQLQAIPDRRARPHSRYTLTTP